MDSDKKDDIKCFQCVYFAITWEPKTPRACKLFGFKTAQMPSAVVFKSSGAPCEGFKRKEKTNNDYYI